MQQLKQECHTERAFTVSDLCMAAFTNPHTVTLCKAERALYCFVFHSNPGWKINCVFVGILDGWLVKVKSLVPIDV
jgi:hypothetical protein